MCNETCLDGPLGLAAACLTVPRHYSFRITNIFCKTLRDIDQSCIRTTFTPFGRPPVEGISIENVGGSSRQFTVLNHLMHERLALIACK